MSPRILKLLELFSDKRTVREESELQVEFKGTYDTDSITVPEAQQLKVALGNFPKRDNVLLSVVIDGVEPTLFTLGEIGEIQAQLDQLSKQKTLADVGAASSLILIIIKPLKKGEVTVYSPDLFLSHLESCSLKDRLAIFNDDFITKAGAVNFVCDEPLARFGSKTITFAVEGEHKKTHDLFDRAALLAKRDDVAHFVEGAIYKLAPDDFHLIESGTNENWQRVFKELTNVLAVAFTADYSTIADNTLSFKINGYTTLTRSLNPADLVDTDRAAAFEIYEWTYQDGSISDRVGLLRNVLSLYLDSKGRPRYDKEVLDSARSGFMIYLKRNVQQYIEIKNRLADFLRNLSKEALGDAEKYADALKGTLGALITFFISTMILSAVGGRGLLGIFNTDITYLTYAFLAVSVVYLVLSLILLNRKRKALEAYYGSLKQQYSDILNDADLDRIFPQDQLEDTAREVKYQAVWITVAWIIVTLVLGAVAFTLHRKQAALPATTSQEIKSTPTTQEQPPSLKNEH